MQLTQKDSKVCWSEPQQTSFDALKEALTSDSILAHPEFDKPFILSCDASNYAISAILSQEHEGKERPLSFASRVLNKPEINYSTTEKELLSVVFGVQTHRCFLYGRRFKIITDDAALKWLITVKNHQCTRLTRWVLKLTEYDFEILHRPSKKHVNADVLSQYIAAAVHKLPEKHGDREADLKPLKEVSRRRSLCRRRPKIDFASRSPSLDRGRDSTLF
jgi:hypothetical protein